ncbi:MAG: DEAD/DEAH box helicase [Acidimicrobiales bacterium]
MTPVDHRARFLASYGFPLDPFQEQALDAIDAGRSVLVAAPTGSGKTVVGEYPVHLALETEGRVFYTTPIKALSNQKYRDLVRRHGSDSVGLLTGDNVINGAAPIVVMTTEVLRNMIYARSSALDELRWVVLDEVHYLQDPYRGPVWEEVIIHAPPEVRLVCLSATVSNAPELAEWITTVRGTTDVVIEQTRPVELVSHYLVGDRHRDRLSFIDTFEGDGPNPHGSRYDVEVSRDRGSGRSGGRRWYTPRRVEVIELLAERDLLPAITFIFSRAACDDAVKTCVDAGLVLTQPSERDRIREIAAAAVADMGDEDLEVLGYDRWIHALEAGIAAHHAGMIPPFKEAVEAVFTEGLVKAVFATETLALGINMPARTVVIEKLSKFGGERHDRLTPGQFTQLTGRAGRRGIDSVGHAVVLWSPFVTFEEVATLAASRRFELTSAFRPTFNMAANLVRRYERDQAFDLIGQSFAQFRADRSVVQIRRRMETRTAARARALEEAACEHGSIEEYRSIESELRASAATPTVAEPEVAEALAALTPGEIIDVPRGSSSGPAVVIGVSQRRGGGVRVRAVGEHRHVLTLGPRDFRTRPDVLGRIDMPVPYAPTSKRFVHDVRSRLRTAALRDRGPRGGRRTRQRGDPDLRRRLRDHPVASCPDLDRHLRAARQVERIDRELTDLSRQQDRRAGSLATQFDHLLDILVEWGHVVDWDLTEAGQLLARIYHESDFLVAECLRDGLFDGIDAPTLAGVVAALTYEHRSPHDPPDPWFPPGPMRERIDHMAAICRTLNRDEVAAGLPPTRTPDPGFSALAHAWASGDELHDVLGDQALTGGDFVRNVKQLIDLLRQLGQVAPDPATASAARAAADALFRGVVATSSSIGGGSAPPVADTTA